MLIIEDKSSGKWKEFIEICLKPALAVIPREDLENIEKVIILDECPDKDYYWAGGFYNAKHDDVSASIELYPPKIVAAQPSFLPKIKYFKKYSIIKMFLHELGHHKYWIRDINAREIMAEKYMLTYLIKIYGKLVYLFDFLGSLDEFFRRQRGP